jgi:hypothetical protein
MTELNLIVKGTAEEAKIAARAHGVPFMVTWEGEHDTIGRTRPRYRANVVRWFASDVKAPYPPGTLLFYREQGVHLYGPTKQPE